MNLTPADRAEWADYEADNRRAADEYRTGRVLDTMRRCIRCGQPRRKGRLYCSVDCYDKRGSDAA